MRGQRALSFRAFEDVNSCLVVMTRLKRAVECCASCCMWLNLFEPACDHRHRSSWDAIPGYREVYVHVMIEVPIFRCALLVAKSCAAN